MNGFGSSLNNPPSREREPKKFETLLHIFRHARKAGGNDVSHEEDLAMPITEQGIEESQEAGAKIERIPGAWSLPVGTQRRRSGETAVYTEEPKSHDPWTSALEERRVWSDKRLDMPFIKGESPEADILIEASGRGEYLKKLFELYTEADGETKNETAFGRQVYNIASLILRQTDVNRKLAERTDYHDGKTDLETPEAIERFMGTHGGITESFLIEFIRRTKGAAESEHFRKLFPQCFEYNEGMDVRILSSPGDSDPEVRIHVDVTAGEGRYNLDEVTRASFIADIVKDFAPPEQPARA